MDVGSSCWGGGWGINKNSFVLISATGKYSEGGMKKLGREGMGDTLLQGYPYPLKLGPTYQPVADELSGRSSSQ